MNFKIEVRMGLHSVELILNDGILMYFDNMDAAEVVARRLEAILVTSGRRQGVAVTIDGEKAWRIEG